MTRILIPMLMLLLGSQAKATDAPDYTNLDLWLCHADNPSYCAQDQSTTVVGASGWLAIEQHVPATAPDVDCFYVYPTVSADAGGNSDFTPNQEEARVIQVQFARFGSLCRTFAPLYRQITLTALRARVSGSPIPMDGALAYSDVRAAWQHYLTHHNQGRGVILIGHSQGTGMLTQLIREQIDGKPLAKQLIAAYLIGTSNVLHPPGKAVGGTFKQLPLCRSDSQTQCIVSFASFRDTAKIPPNALFGQARDPAMRHLTTACNLPGALAGGPAPLHAYLSATGENLASSSAQAPWTTAKPTLTTAFASVPGLLEGECVTKNGFSYLEVRVQGDPDDARVDDIAGDVVIGGQVAEDWGLHLIDMHLVMGNLVALAKSQADAYLAGP